MLSVDDVKAVPAMNVTFLALAVVQLADCVRLSGFRLAVFCYDGWLLSG